MPARRRSRSANPTPRTAGAVRSADGVSPRGNVWRRAHEGVQQTARCTRTCYLATERGIALPFVFIVEQVSFIWSMSADSATSFAQSAASYGPPARDAARAVVTNMCTTNGLTELMALAFFVFPATVLLGQDPETAPPWVETCLCIAAATAATCSGFMRFIEHADPHTAELTRTLFDGAVAAAMCASAWHVVPRMCSCIGDNPFAAYGLIFAVVTAYVNQRNDGRVRKACLFTLIVHLAWAGWITYRWLQDKQCGAKGRCRVEFQNATIN